MPGTPESARRFDAVLFDLGSTLIYFDSTWTEILPEADCALITALNAGGVTLAEERFLPEYRARIEAYYAERDTEFIEYTTAYVLKTYLSEMGYAEVPDSLIHAALEAMYRVTQAHWQLEADTLQTLRWLKERGYRLGMISNAGDDADVQSLVDNAGIRDFFDVIVTSASAGIRKPNPRIFHMALQALGTPPERAVMVGDTLGADILGAHNAGLPAVWITRRADTPDNQAHEDTILPEWKVGTLAELAQLFEDL